MNRIILIPLLAFLTGCVTHHHHYIQASEADSGALYSESPSEYAEYSSVPEVYTDYSADYSSASYYPWWSVDYFYLSPYRRHNSISVGFNVGYGSAFYDPFYWSYAPFSVAYSPFYYSHFYGPYWYGDYRRGYSNWYSYSNYYWRYRYNHYHSTRHHDHDTWQRDHNGYGNRDRSDRYAGSFDNRRRRGEDNRVDPVDRGGDRPPGGRGQPQREPGVNRHVSVAPGTSSGERGMEVRNRQERKPVETRIEPVNPVRKLSPADGVTVVTPRPQDRVYRSVRGYEGEVRSYSGNKQARTQPGPVTPPQQISQDRNIVSGKTKIHKYSESYSVSPAPEQSKARPVKTRPVHPQSPASSVDSSRNYRSSSYGTNTGPVIRVEPSRQVRSDRTQTAPREQLRAPARNVYQQAPPRVVTARPAGSQSQPAPSVSSRPAPAASRQARPPAATPQSKASPRAARERKSEAKPRSEKKDER